MASRGSDSRLAGLQTEKAATIETRQLIASRPISRPMCVPSQTAASYSHMLESEVKRDRETPFGGPPQVRVPRPTDPVRGAARYSLAMRGSGPARRADRRPNAIRRVAGQALVGSQVEIAVERAQGVMQAICFARSRPDSRGRIVKAKWLLGSWSAYRS